MSNTPFMPAVTPAHLFIVGTEDYVYRVLKSKLRSKGVTVTGHAPKHWQPPFAPPRGTTHLLVVEDDCPGLLRVHAEKLVHETVGLDLVIAPARNRWGETEELLRRHGVLEPMENAAAPLPTAPDLRPTIGELIAAKKVEEPEKPKPAVVEEAVVPEPEPEPAPPAATAPPPAPVPAAAVPHQVVVAPKALAIEILRATEGYLTDGDVARLVSSRTQRHTTADEVERWRLEAGARVFKKGPKPARLLPVFERYGLSFKDPSKVAREIYAIRRGNRAAAGEAEKRAAPPPPPPPPSTKGAHVSKVAASDPRYQYAVQQIKKDPSLTNWPLDNEIKAKFGKMIGGNALNRIRVENKLPPSRGRLPARPNGVKPQAEAVAATKAPPTRRQPAAKSPPPAAKPPADDFASELRAALVQLTDFVITPHHVSRMELVWEDGKWSVPTAERVTVVSGKVEI